MSEPIHQPAAAPTEPVAAPVPEPLPSPPPAAVALAPEPAAAVPPVSPMPAELAPMSVAPPGFWPDSTGYAPVWAPIQPPKAKWSKALWVFAPLLVVLLTGLGVAGVVYANDRAVADRTLIDQQKHIDELNRTVDDNAATLTKRDGELAKTRDDVDNTAAQSKPYEKCSSLARQYLEAVEARDTATAQSLVLPLANACQVSL